MLRDMLYNANVELLPGYIGFYVYDTPKSRTVLIKFCENNNYAYLAEQLRTQKKLNEMCLRTEKYEGNPVIWVFM